MSERLERAEELEAAETPDEADDVLGDASQTKQGTFIDPNPRLLICKTGTNGGAPASRPGRRGAGGGDT